MMKYVLGLKEMPLFDFTKEDNCNEDLCLKITFNCGKLQSSVQVNFQKVKDEVENETMECSLEGTFSHNVEKIAVLSYFDCDKKDIETDVMEVSTIEHCLNTEIKRSMGFTSTYNICFILGYFVSRTGLISNSKYL